MRWGYSLLAILYTILNARQHGPKLLGSVLPIYIISLLRVSIFFVSP